MIKRKRKNGKIYLLNETGELLEMTINYALMFLIFVSCM
jgi:hypothetical protein